MESSVHNEISVLPGSEKALASRITVWKEFAQLATSELKKMGKNRAKRETAELDTDLQAKADGDSSARLAPIWELWDAKHSGSESTSDITNQDAEAGPLAPEAPAEPIPQVQGGDDNMIVDEHSLLFIVQFEVLADKFASSSPTSTWW